MSRHRVYSKFFVVSLAVVCVFFCSGVVLAQAAAPAAPAPAPSAGAAPLAAAPSAAAPAREARGGLSAENAGTAWELEAKTIARQLKLNDEKTGKLVAAYKEARSSHRTALQAKLGEGTRPDQDNYAAMREVATAERGKLETALKGFLSAEETETALKTLGTFSRRWDQMVTVLAGMKLDPKVESQAMDTVAGYVAETSALMAQAAEGDREAMRSKNQQAREKLDAAMAKILSPEQLAKWKEATQRRRGR